MKKIIALTLFFVSALTVYSQKSPDPETLFPIVQNGKWGLMKKDGEVFIIPRYDYVDYYFNGLALVKLNGLYGYIDPLGREVIPPQFHYARRFSEGYAVVGEKFTDSLNQFNYINTKGEGANSSLGMILYASDFHNSRALVTSMSGGSLSIINKNMEVAFESKSCLLYEDTSLFFHDGLLKAYCNNHLGYLDTMGRVFLNPMFDDGGDFSEGLACYYQTNLAGYMNNNGESVIAPKWDLGYPFSEGMARVVVQTVTDPITFEKTGGVIGFIDKTGTEIILPQYEKAGDFHGGLAWVKVNGKYGYIDKTGKMILPATFDAAYDFFRGLAFVKTGSIWEYIDMKGKVIWQSTQ